MSDTVGPIAMRPVPFAQFEAEVLTLYQEPHKRRRTLQKVRQVLREVGVHCRSTEDLDPVAIARWLSDYPDRRASSRKSLLATLRAACSYAEFKGYARNPFQFRKLASWVPADELEDGDLFPRHRSAEEIRRVLARADLEASTGDWLARRLRACVYLWAYTGAGALEVLGLRVRDVDLAGGILTVRSHPRRRLKTGARAALLPIAEPVAEVLGDWVPRTRSEWLIPHQRLTGPWFYGTHGRRPLDRVKQLGERAGVEGLTILAFRHSFGTLSEDWGIGELMLQRILRHSRSRTQRYYRHHDAELLQRAAAKVQF